MKVIINVAENYQPNDKDLLVYNSKEERWCVVNIDHLLKEQQKNIVRQSAELEMLREEFKKVSQNFNETLEILKEHLKND